MPDTTNYFAIHTDDLSAVESLLKSHQTPAILHPVPPTARHHWPDLPANRRWLVVLYPPPWTDDSLLQLALSTVELRVNELNGDWQFRIIHHGQQLLGRFQAAREHLSGQQMTAEITPFSDEERQRIADFFGMPYSRLDAALLPGRAADFCKIVGIPYLAGLDQDDYQAGTPEYAYLQENGFVAYAEDVFGG